MLGWLALGKKKKKDENKNWEGRKIRKNPSHPLLATGSGRMGLLVLQASCCSLPWSVRPGLSGSA